MPEPEQIAREKIDHILKTAGWIIQDRGQMNLMAGTGVAVREFPLETGYADYLLFNDGKAFGVIEAKPYGTTLSGLGDHLGLGEWIITEFDTDISSQELGDRFSFHFEAQRRNNYYILHIFIPIAIIIIVSWVTFFLRDYGKRVEIAAGNLLIFITYNFTIADELPHLGTLTLMDMILASTFSVTGLVVVYNVYLKRLENSGKEDLAERIDRYMDWAYPLIYAAGIALTFWVFG